MAESPEGQGQNRPGSSSYEKANLFQRLTYTWVSPLTRRTAGRPAGEEVLEESDVAPLVPGAYDARQLYSSFEKEYEKRKTLFWTLVFLHRPLLGIHALLILGVTGMRLVSPFVLREYLRWLTSKGAEREGSKDEWKGFMLAVALGACSLLQALVNHQQPWYGVLLGFLMKQQATAAVHAKALRLNAAAVAEVSPGTVINLVSNDVRRFDDACFYWLYLWSAPLELGGVLLAVALELGPAPAFAGISATLALIPMQALLVQPVASIRRATAQRTDERVRLASEAIQGALACKMLGWEDPLAGALRKLRGAEASQVARMARIRACNMALQFIISCLVTFATFAVYRARGGELAVASVFFSLSLLQLPRRTMSSFVSAVQAMTEMRVSLQRFDAFLNLPEPPPPVHQQHLHEAKGQGQERGSAQRQQPGPKQEAGGAGGQPPQGTVALNGADFDWQQPFGDHAPEGLKATAGTAGVKKQGGAEPNAAAPTAAAAAGVQGAVPAPRVVVAGKGGDPEQAASGAGEGAASAKQQEGASDNGSSSRATLAGVQLQLQPGELLGVCGEVGCGKTTLLAALLGEVLPLSRSSTAVTGSTGQVLPAPQLSGSSNMPDAQATVKTFGHAAGGPGGVQGQVMLQLDGPEEQQQHSGPAPVVVRGSVAYCAQIPWIVAGTVRDNITFGGPWDADGYAAVLAACALGPDIAALPAGDATELGERGINLSGGQKARVALARAVYSQPAVALLDDPLSAVDPAVGRTLFQKAIGPGSLLQGATRVLVTHQRQYLPRCDRVLVLRGGRVVALGSWQEVSGLGLPELASAVEGPMHLALDDGEGQQQGGKEEAEADHGAAGIEEAAASAAEPVPEPEAASGESTPAEPGISTASTSSSGMPVGPAGSSKQKGLGDKVDEVELVLASPGGGQSRHETDGPELCAAPSFRTAPSFFAPPAALFFWGRGASIRRAAQPSGPSVTASSAASHGAHGRLLASPPSMRRGAWAAGLGLGLGASFRRPPSAAAGVAGLPKEAKEQGQGEPTSKVQESAKKGQLVQAEGRVIGTVSLSVYGRYLLQMGALSSALIILTLFSAQASYLAAEWWLSMWSRASPLEQKQDKWLWVYGLLTALVVVLGLARAFLFFSAALRASSRLHDAMVTRVLRAPLSFFHTNPAGRILNRFSKDQGTVDDQLPVVIFDAIQCGMLVLGAIVLVSAAVPYILPIFVPLGLAFLWVRRRYVAASREIKRWESVTRSPVFATFSATLKGLPTIRAYGAQPRFHRELLDQLADNGRWAFAFSATGRWIGFRLDLISCTTLLVAALLAVGVRHQVRPALLGLALSHLLQMTGIMQWFVRQTAEVENAMTCTERMLEYTTLPQEPPRVAEGGGAPPPGWPAAGQLEFDQVCARYRPGLAPVLQDLSFRLEAGTTCGVVGRTGSGKSSLALTLFRLIEVTSGRVLLAGQDVAQIGLDALRSQLAIIPQDPVLFSGTVRSNLDPWDRHPDAALWAALRAVRLQPAVSALGGLGSRMAEAGDNLSAGQRQLFCLARALLQKAKVLCLDEATANVDRATDELIHRALHSFAHGEEAVDSTGGSEAVAGVAAAEGRGVSNEGRVLLIIAHRVDTILDADHLLVLGAGRLLEQGNPRALSEKAGGVFHGMVSAARLAAKAQGLEAEAGSS